MDHFFSRFIKTGKEKTILTVLDYVYTVGGHKPSAYLSKIFGNFNTFFKKEMHFDHDALLL